MADEVSLILERPFPVRVCRRIICEQDRPFPVLSFRFSGALIFRVLRNRIKEVAIVDFQVVASLHFLDVGVVGNEPLTVSIQCSSAEF